MVYGSDFEEADGIITGVDLGLGCDIGCAVAGQDIFAKKVNELRDESGLGGEGGSLVRKPGVCEA